MRQCQLCGLLFIIQFNSANQISNTEALKIIREIASDGIIIFSHHAKERMIERGYTSHDVEYILMHGKIDKQEFQDKTQTWTYKISGADLEGDDGTIIVAIIKRMSAVIITVLG